MKGRVNEGKKAFKEGIEKNSDMQEGMSYKDEKKGLEFIVKGRKGEDGRYLLRESRIQLEDILRGGPGEREGRSEGIRH